MQLLQNGIFLDLFVGLISYFNCCIVKCCFMWFVIMCVYYTVPFVTNLVWRLKVVWLRITDEHTVVANSPATCWSHREQPPCPRDPHKEFSQPINLRSFNLLKIVNWLVCVYFIYRANCLYKKNQYTYNGHCWSLNKDFLLWITVKISYDYTGNVPYKDTQTFGKMYWFVICMISRYWFQTKLLLYIA